MTIQNIITFISALTMLSQVGLGLAIIYLLTPNNRLQNFISKYANALIFVLALVATGGSLFFSQVAGFEPCELCWFQRIFMYPQVLLFGLAWFRQERLMIKYALPLVGIGWLIALYHNYIYYLAVTATSCSITSHVSCIVPYFTKFGYITIPIMSLTSFTLIGFILLVVNKAEKTSKL
jgi:disulfide bond formation protein DsbB